MPDRGWELAEGHGPGRVPIRTHSSHIRLLYAPTIFSTPFNRADNATALSYPIAQPVTGQQGGVCCVNSPEKPT